MKPLCLVESHIRNAGALFVLPHLHYVTSQLAGRQKIYTQHLLRLTCIKSNTGHLNSKPFGDQYNSTYHMTFTIHIPDISKPGSWKNLDFGYPVFGQLLYFVDYLG